LARFLENCRSRNPKSPTDESETGELRIRPTECYCSGGMGRRKLQVTGFASRTLGLLLCCACASKAARPESSVAQSHASIAGATVASSSRGTVSVPDVERPTTRAPTRSFTATWVESGRTTYTALNIGANGELRGTPLGPWETLFNSGAPTVHIGSLVMGGACGGVAPPELPKIDDDDRYHLLSARSECAYLEFVPQPKTQVTVQWYGTQPNDHAIAVVRPPVEPAWLLILADTLLSPAGPWLVPQRLDLDGDGVLDIAFVAQGVDCDSAPCPLFWVDLLLSRTHTILRGSSSELLTTGNFERRTGLEWDKTAELTWQSHAETGLYTVIAHAGKRTLTWTVRVGSSGVVVTPDAARAVTTKSR
jgi:hypothetical protein